MMPVLIVSEVCQRLNFTNFGSVGQCLVDGVFWGDTAITGVVLFILVTALVVRYNFPIQTILPVGIALSYVLYLMTGLELFIGILILGLIIGGAILVIGLLQYMNR